MGDYDHTHSIDMPIGNHDHSHGYYPGTTYYPYSPAPQQGWICPKCGRCYSPSTFMCYGCDPANSPVWLSGSPWNLQGGVASASGAEPPISSSGIVAEPPTEAKPIEG